MSDDCQLQFILRTKLMKMKINLNPMSRDPIMKKDLGNSFGISTNDQCRSWPMLQKHQLRALRNESLHTPMYFDFAASKLDDFDNILQELISSLK